eukprot:TRINITY_DN7432_c0_g1_i1.p1 TRINITY_DN7432_c0_g1~~TRINITY_DN7432_c0_g1_i1.p1  ORF type:complete len:311 (-),score=71.45 TRINITY_DN7432_c0_g1_i1:30-962(-)
MGDTYAALEELIHKDPGDRGIAEIFQQTQGSLREAAHVLCKSNRVAILVGFFIKSKGKQENDGLIGSIEIAEALLQIGKDVVMITDEPNRLGLEVALRAADLSTRARLHIYPTELTAEKSEEYAASWILQEKLDCIVSIERPGRAADGRYYSMRAIDMTDVTAPADELFLQVHKARALNLEAVGRVQLVAIGDGGNECGTGSISSFVRQYVPNGETIACVVNADHLILAGVSDWGGMALALAISYCALRDNPKLSAERYKTLLAELDHAGIIDGVIGKPNATVDGMDVGIHASVISEMRRVIAEHKPLLQ